MGRFRLDLEYEGTRYSGWQIQKGGKSVQGEIADACRELFGTGEFELYGAGRTDAGVHALRQCAHLDVKTDLEPLRIKYGINDRLPHDISVIDVTEADSQFHARYDAELRSYIYLISRRRTAFGKRFVWWIKDTLDAEIMAKAASIFEGAHDFKSFTDPEQEQKSTRTRIVKCSVETEGSLIIVHVAGTHFLWKQVRRMTGVIVEAGRGKLDLSEINRMLRQYSDIPAKLTAPPSGLFLERVYYKGEKMTDKPSVLLSI
jgi:tRNA pseudouridine38-40 synthase